MVQVFRFQLYDVSTDGYTVSRRWGTREGITKVGGEVIEDTATEIDDAAIGDEIEGLTARGFDPHRTVGFQQQVRDFNPYKTTNAGGLFRS
jgi:hypothetical protein